MMPLMLADTSLTCKRGYPIIHRATTSEPEGWLSIGDALVGWLGRLLGLGTGCISLPKGDRPSQVELGKLVSAADVFRQWTDISSRLPGLCA